MSLKTYTVRDERGRTIEVKEQHILRHLREPFKAILIEMGYPPEQVIAFDGDIGYLVNLIVDHIRDQHCRLETSREEFKKLRAKQDADHDTIVQFIRQQTGVPIDTTSDSTVIPLEPERKVA